MVSILYRGSEEVSRGENYHLDINRRIILRYTRNLPVGGAYNKPDPAAILECWVELFEAHPFKCPICHCQIFNSTNWREMPDWLVHQELKRMQYEKDMAKLKAMDQADEFYRKHGPPTL